MITYKEIREIKKHLAKTHHDQEWWDFTSTSKVTVVQSAIACLIGTQPTESDLYKEANEQWKQSENENWRINNIYGD